MEDPDDPARQDEVARRLIAYAAKLREESGHESGEFDRSDEMDGGEA